MDTAFFLLHNCQIKESRLRDESDGEKQDSWLKTEHQFGKQMKNIYPHDFIIIRVNIIVVSNRSTADSEQIIIKIT